MIKVFTDGSCINNGKPNAIAGIGIYFGDLDVRNVSSRIGGKQTNNTAELTAVIRVFDILRREIENKMDINIYTDSEYVMKCAGSYGGKSELRDWKFPTGPKKGQFIPNHKLVEIIYNAFRYNNCVKLHHVRAHTGFEDELSKGNENADHLASISVNKSVNKIVNKSINKLINRTYINVPFDKKEIAKKYGAKWDPKKKSWYYSDTTNPMRIQRLNELFKTN